MPQEIQSVFENFQAKNVESYCDYWREVTPKTEDEIFQRWLFAFTSIHTRWEGNVRGYFAIRQFHDWINNKEALHKKLLDARVGMHNVRTNYIWNFSQDYWANREQFSPLPNETYLECRNRISKRITGMGIAKVSFTLEMIDPMECDVVCLDVHMLSLFGMKNNIGYNQGKPRDRYLEMEQVWTNYAKQHDVPSYIARSIYWDSKQEQTDSRYWSYVFEQ